MDIAQALLDLEFQKQVIDKTANTLKMLNCVTEFAKQATNQSIDDTIKMVGIKTSIRDNRLFVLSLPRFSGKTTAAQIISRDPEVALVKIVDLSKHFFRGSRLPFGPSVKVFLFDDPRNMEDLKDAIEVVAQNWRLWGYDGYPSFVVIGTLTK